MVLKNIKSFTAMKIIDSIINNIQESRKNCLTDYGIPVRPMSSGRAGGDA